MRRWFSTEVTTEALVIDSPIVEDPLLSLHDNTSKTDKTSEMDVLIFIMKQICLAILQQEILDF
jgi:hypothetical protein